MDKVIRLDEMGEPIRVVIQTEKGIKTYNLKEASMEDHMEVYRMLSTGTVNKVGQNVV